MLGAGPDAVSILFPVAHIVRAAQFPKATTDAADHHRMSAVHKTGTDNGAHGDAHRKSENSIRRVFNFIVHSEMGTRTKWPVASCEGQITTH